MWTLGPSAVSLRTQSERDFCFVLQKDKYFCSKAAACFLSNKVARKMAENPNFRKLRIRSPNGRGVFSYFMDVLSGIEVDTTSPRVDLDKLMAIAKELENDEIYMDLLAFKWDRVAVSEENVFQRIEAKRSQGLWPQAEIDFLAANMDKVVLPKAKENPKLFTDMGPEFCDALIFNPEMKSEAYDEVAALALRGGEAFKPLVRKLQFDKLGEESMAAFAKVFTLDDVDDELWMRLCRRLVMPIGAAAAGERVAPVNFTEFPVSPGSFSGIIAHLRDVCGGNPHLKGLISITASSDDWNQCYQLVDYGWHSYWYTQDEPNAYVQIDFLAKKVCVSGYSLRYGELGNCGFPLEWVLEVSDDASSWTVIDTQNNRDLDGNYVAATYTCNAAVTTFHQYVRLRQTAKNSRNNDFLLLSEIELFGKLVKD